jgi:hypothetical protein
MNARTAANRKFPIPNEGAFRPEGAGVFKLAVIRSASLLQISSPPSRGLRPSHRWSICLDARGKANAHHFNMVFA